MAIKIEAEPNEMAEFLVNLNEKIDELKRDQYGYGRTAGMQLANAIRNKKDKEGQDGTT